HCDPAPNHSAAPPPAADQGGVSRATVENEGRARQASPLMERRTGSAVILAVLGCIVLIGLGVWQLYRLQWKEALIADLNARLAAPPVSLSEAIEHPQEFLHVNASGNFVHQGEMFVL